MIYPLLSRPDSPDGLAANVSSHNGAVKTPVYPSNNPGPLLPNLESLLS